MTDPVVSAPRQSLLPFRLREAATFDNYRVPDQRAGIGATGSGHPARNDIREILKQQLRYEEASLWFTWVWGEQGAGRTHLLQAACRHAGDHGLRAAYVPLTELPSPDALDGLSGFNLLCLDDLDSVLGDAGWEQALFMLINEFRDSINAGGRQALVVSARAAPGAQSVALMDLSTRLLTALPLACPRLGDEEKLALIRQKARGRGIELPDEAASYILHRLDRNPGHLLRALDKLDEASLMDQKRVTIPFIKQVLNL
ncbi:MAG: DnaA regulatory inactivator Hda [Gammaproteobacteria bacterium]|nr:DnaA regulatory inactivator Hda [Gammaproteobacteria bacterium]